MRPILSVKLFVGMSHLQKGKHVDLTAVTVIEYLSQLIYHNNSTEFFLGIYAS